MSLEVGKLRAVLEMDSTHFEVALSRAKADLRNLADQAENMGRSTKEAGQQAAQGASRTAQAAQDAGRGFQRQAQEAHRAGQEGRKAGEQSARGMKSATGAASGFSLQLGRVKTVAAGLGVALGAHQAAQFFAGAINSAREAEAIMLRTTNTFTDASGAVEDWASTAGSALGMSEDAAKSAALQFSSFGIALGQSGDELATYSTGLAELAGDLAAYGDYDISTVVQDMSAALSGSQEPMRKYGVLLDQATLREVAFSEGITESNRELTQQERVLATTAALHSELGYAVGASERAQGTYGHSVRQLRANFENARAELGERFLPIVTTITDALAGPGIAAFSGFGTAVGAILTPISKLASMFAGIPGPIQTAIGAMVAMRLGAMALATTMGQTVVASITSGIGAVRNFGITLAGQVGVMRASIAQQGLFSASMSGISAAAGGVRRGLSNVVGMLGGPWMIALGAAIGVVTDFVTSARSAREAQDEMAESSARAATAQDNLRRALAEANGEMSDTAVAEAQKIIEEAVTSKNAAVGESEGMIKSLANWTDELFLSYDDLVGKIDQATNAWDAERWAGRVAEIQMEALKEAASDLGIEMDDVAAVVEEGGPRWDALRARLEAIGPEGRDMAAALIEAKASVDGIVDSATEAEIASMMLADAFRVMADESSTAEEKTNALKQALDALAGDTLTADEATGKFYETMAKLDEEIGQLSEGTGEFTRVLEDGSLAFDMTSEKGRDLHATMLEMRDSIAEVRDSGAPMSEVMAENQARMEALAAQTGLTTDELLELGERMGFIPELIETMVALDGGGQVIGELGNVRYELDQVAEGTQIEVKNVSDEALEYLNEVGYQAHRIAGSDTDILVTAQSEEAQRKLQATLEAATNLANVDPDINIETNADAVSVLLDIARDKVEDLPDGDVVIDHEIPGIIDLLEVLEIETRRDKHGRLVIDSSDVDRARTHAESLNTLHTQSRHTVVIDTINNMSMPDVPLPSMDGFADGGMLPGQATIQQPYGSRGLVQWAEPETGGEAFIPLAPAKRDRSTRIWAETGRRLGVLPDANDPGGDLGGLLGKFANGGILASSLNRFARGVEGKPYVWGGVNWGDCSGAVSALANFVSGRDPFGSRFATASQRQGLRERGFQMGRGGPGDLRIGWYNGGPYGGHTSATLPNGVNFEMGGARGNGQYGGSAAGADSGAYTDHAYFPVRAVDAQLGGEAFDAIGAALGTGNPDMPNQSGSPSANGLNVTMSGGGHGGHGTPVYVTNWPGRSSGTSPDNITAQLKDGTNSAFIEGMSIAGAIANATGHGDLVKVETFADGGFHGLENHSAHIAPAGSYRIFAESETGGEAYIPLASHKRARSTAILAETARRFGYTLGAGVNLAGSVLTGNGLNTGWGGPGLADLGIDSSALQESVQPHVNANAEQLARDIAEAAHRFLSDAQTGVDEALRAADDHQSHLRQQYARALI